MVKPVAAYSANVNEGIEAGVEGQLDNFEQTDITKAEKDAIGSGGDLSGQSQGLPQLGAGFP